MLRDVALQGRPLTDRIPDFFGGSNQPLFGCFHPAHEGAVRRGVAVICNPIQQEYIRSHRALLQLAVRLQRLGMPVLRFDYRGTGDSAGDVVDFGLMDWCEDIRTATEYARSRSGRDDLILIGMRMGGSLAALAAQDVDPLLGLVLWDPIVDGRRHLEILAEDHREMMRLEYVSVDHDGAGHSADEMLEFEWSRSLRDSIAELNLRDTLSDESDHPVLVLESQGAGGGAKGGVDSVRLRGGDVRRINLEERGMWLSEPFRGLVPSHALREIVSWTGEVAGE